MSGKLSKTIATIVFAVLAVVMLVLVFKDVDFKEMWQAILGVDYAWVGVGLVFAIGAYIVRAVRWNLLIDSTCEHAPSFWNSFWAEMFGYFANTAFPRLGEVARCGALNRTETLPFDTLIGTVIVERAFDVIVMLLLMIVTFFLQIDFFGSFITDKIIAPTINAFTTGNIVWIAVISIIIIALIVAILYIFHKKNSIIVSKIVSFCQGIFDGIKSVYKLEKRSQFLILTILLWACYWMGTWMTCFAITQTSGLGLDDALFLLVVGSIGMVVPVQGGFGAYHYIVATALTIYGLNFNTDGLLFATVSHESQFFVEIILGVASLIFVYRKKE